MNLFTKKKQNHRPREQTHGWGGGKEGQRDREFMIDMYTVQFSLGRV